MEDRWRVYEALLALAALFSISHLNAASHCRIAASESASMSKVRSLWISERHLFRVSGRARLNTSVVCPATHRMMSFTRIVFFRRFPFANVFHLWSSDDRMDKTPTCVEHVRELVRLGARMGYGIQLSQTRISHECARVDKCSRSHAR